MELRYLIIIIIGLILLSGCVKQIPKECKDAEIPERCVHQLALERNDETYCRSIKGDRSRDICFQKIGIAKKDVSICKKASIRESDFCIYEIVKQVNDISLCKEMDNDEICYRYFAMLNNDLSICNKVTYSGKVGKQYYIDECKAYVAEKILDPNICNNIQTDSWRNTCWQFMAVGFKDDSYCENVADKVFAEGRWVPSGAPIYCYSFTARAMKDYRVCHKIPDENKADKDNCYFFVAIDVDDPSICEYLSEGSRLKPDCILQAKPK